MRVLDWERLLTEQRIPFIRSGPNVKRGEINVRCPFCGTADPSHHMGLNLTTGWWACWRNRAEHSGKSPLRLLMRLLRVPYAQARELAGLGADYVDPEGFDALAARLMHRGETARPETVQRKFLEFDRDFEVIKRRGRTARFWNYLYERGFDGASGVGEDVNVLCDLYSLRAGTSGVWSDRIVLPYFLDGELVTWSARAIGPSVRRYRDLEVEQSLLAPKETLFNADCIMAGGKALIVCEGPIDALKIDLYGRPWGVRAVALSTNSIQDDQAYLLQPAADKFERVLAMMDNASALGIVDSMRMRQALHFLKNSGTVAVPFGKKDAGELRPRQVIEWAHAL